MHKKQWFAVLGFVVAAAAQPPLDLLEQGRQLARQLTGNSQADLPRLSALPFDRVLELLTAVSNQGSELQATSSDWQDAHRALDGVIELSVAQEKWLIAAIYANLQSTAYTREERVDRSLEYDRQGLEFSRKAGNTENLYVQYLNIAQDLKKLARLDEAWDALQQARDAVPSSQAFSNKAIDVWRDLIAVALARKDVPAAKAAVTGFQRFAESPGATEYFKGAAVLANTSVLLQENRFTEVPAVVKYAMQLASTPKIRKQIGNDAVLVLLDCVLAMANSVSYADAESLATKLDRDIEGLPFPISALAQLTMRARRRGAGFSDAVLREDEAELAYARQHGDLRAQAEILPHLAVDFQSANSFANQIATLQEAVRLQKQLMSPDGQAHNRTEAKSFARTLLELATAYRYTRQFGLAQEALQSLTDYLDRQAAALVQVALAPLRARALLEKAEVLRLAGERTKAREILEKALGDPGGHYERAQLFRQLARLEGDTNPGAARKNYDLSIAAHRAANEDIWIVDVQVEAAHYFAGKGQWQTARAYLNDSAKGLASANLAHSGWQVSFVSGVIWEGEGQTAKALAAYEDAVSRIEVLRSHLSQMEHRQSFRDTEWIGELYARWTALLTRIGRHESAWQAVEREKAQSFVESLQGKQFHETVPPQFAPQLAQLQQRMTALRSQEDSNREAQRKTELDALQKQFLLLRQEAGLSTSRASQAVRLNPPSLQELQSKLGKSSAIVEYSILPDTFTAFLITNTSFEQLSWKVDGPGLLEEVTRLRSWLGDPESAQRVGPLLAKVSEMVWHPIAAKLPSNVDRLLLIPSGYLHYLPFQAMLLPNGQSIIDRYAISYLPSASTLLLLNSPPRGSRDLFLGALGSISVDGNPALPFTLEEIAGIAKIYPEAKVAKEAALTHDAAMQALQTQEQVHFATHGVLDAGAPLFSALLVSPAPGQSERLSLYELMDVQLKARLVVLSACKTGLGTLFRGDEIAGLTRTLLSAGAGAVVSSLWQVNDESTALLMQVFYRQLHNGASPADALRSAGLAVRKRFPDPTFWAPFVVTGGE